VNQPRQTYLFDSYSPRVVSQEAPDDAALSLCIYLE
jgi:hypothetical protein